MDAEPIARPIEGESGSRLAAALPLALALAVTAWVWQPITALSFSGEDYVILARLAHGASGSEHVFRPLPDLWLDLLHRAFGADGAAPYHGASLLLHLLNASLVFLLAVRLLRSTLAAGLAALAFGVGAGVADSLAWIAACNRPLSALGALVAVNGLARLDVRSRLAPVLVALGLGWQLLCNEEAYGTAALVVAWLAARAVRPVSGSRLLPILGAVAVALATAGHYLLLERVPGGAAGLLEGGLASVGRNAPGWAGAVIGGFGLPGWLGLVLPPLCGLALAARGLRSAAALSILYWSASFVPFVLSDAVGYRLYPTQAPTALLLAGAALALARSPLPRHALFAALCAAAALGSNPRRVARLDRWHGALGEIAACADGVRERARLDPDRVPALVNLESSTVGLFVYHFGLAGGDLPASVAFLDGASAFVPPRDPPPGPWFGRRCEGSYGVIEPEAYLAARPRIEGVRLYGDALAVGSLAEAREALAEAALDLDRRAVAEVDPEALANLPGPSALAGAEVEVLEPFAGDPAARSATMAVAVRAATPTILAIQEGWLYSHLLRFSPDQKLFSNVERGRVLETRARLRAGGEDLTAFFLNAYGTGVLIPAGDHVIELSWSIATPQELR